MKRLISLAALVTALGLYNEAASDDAQPTHVVAKGPLAVTVDADGAFESADAFEARFKPEAYAGELIIREIAKHGAQVKKGDVLVKFDRAPFERQLAAAENDLRGAEAGLQAAEDSVKWGSKQDAIMQANAKEGLEEAEKRLEYWVSIDGPHMLKNHEQGMKMYEDYVADQEEELDQLKKMYSSEELTTATADIVVKRAQRQLDNAKMSLGMRKEAGRKTTEWDYPRAKARIERDVEQAKIGLAQTESGILNGRVQRETQLVRAKMEVERQREALDKLKKDGDKFTITAGSDGWVVYGQLANGNWTFNEDMLKTMVVGERANANMVLMTVVSRGKCFVRTNVGEDRLMGLKEGSPVRVTPVARPDQRVAGKVSFVSFVPVGGVFPVRIDLDSPLEALPGSKCKVSIEIADLKSAVLVPASAVGSEGGKTLVWVKTGDKVEAREIELGISNGTLHEVKKGLNGGETILLTAQKK